MPATTPKTATPAPVATTGRRREIAGIGRIAFWQGGSVWIGRDSGAARPHEHHALQLSIALDGEFLLRVPGAPWAAHRAALVPAHLKHQFEGQGATVAQLFCEPYTQVGRALMARTGHAAIMALDGLHAPLCALIRNEYVRGVPDADLAAAAQRALLRVAALPAAGEPRAGDPRVQRVLEALRAQPGGAHRLADGAALAHLSPGRLRHLFVAETGTTFRAWLLWLRLLDAVQRAMAGATWTEAAHHAGFADSAHLSRSFRRMFGVVPAMLVVESRPPTAGQTASAPG